MKAILAIALVLVLGGLGVCYRGCDYGYSDGSRSGTVTKLSKKGMGWKSWEGELLMGGVRNRTSVGASGDVHTSAQANVWAFSVTDDVVAKEIQAAMDAGESVELRYRQWLTGPAYLDTQYNVEKIVRQVPERTGAPVPDGGHD